MRISIQNSRLILGQRNNMNLKDQLDELQKQKGYIATNMELLRSKFINIQQQICVIMNKQRNNERIVEEVIKKNRNES